MQKLKIEIENYSVVNTEFLGFFYENSSEQKHAAYKERFYIYKYLETVEIVDYQKLHELTGLSKNNLRVIVHELKCKKNGTK